MKGGPTGPNHPGRPSAAGPTADALLAVSRFEECAALATVALTGLRTALTTHPPGSAAGREARARLADTSYWRGFALMRMGDVTGALTDLTVAGEHPGRRRPAALAALVECRIARGESRLAERWAPALEKVAGDPWAQWGLADLAEARGDHEAAADGFARVGAMIDDHPRTSVLIQWRAAQALSLTRLGHRREASLLAREALRRAQMYGAPYARAQALRCLAAVNPTSDRADLLRSALTVLRGIKALRLEAQVSTDLAGVLALTSATADESEALALLRRAEQIAVELHLRPLRDRIVRLRMVSGPALTPIAFSSPTLTVSERRVADLVAAGVSNREVASRLLVTTKGVEWHLSRIYRKLGISGRRGLPAALAQLPVAPSTVLPSTTSTVPPGSA